MLIYRKSESRKTQSAQLCSAVLQQRCAGTGVQESTLAGVVVFQQDGAGVDIFDCNRSRCRSDFYQDVFNI